jgi:hypothetical protein
MHPPNAPPTQCFNGLEEVIVRKKMITAGFSLFLILSACFILSTHAYSAFIIRLEAHEQVCYWEKLTKHQRLDLSFQVADGGNLDIDFWVVSTLYKL